MEDREKLLREEKISKLLLKLSLPAMFAMMINALYNVVDTIFVGKGVGAYAIGALTVSFPIQMALLALALLIGVGAQTNISISYGAGKLDQANKYILTAYITSFFIGILVTIFGYIFMTPIFKLFGATDTLMPLVRDYMIIIFFGSTATILSVVNNNILRAEGNAKLSMALIMVGTILNIILDPIFIFVLQLGIKGAAYATVISQYTTVFISIIFMFKKKTGIPLKIKGFKYKFIYLKNIFKIGFPSFIRQILASVLSIFLNNVIVQLGGDITLSAYGVINRISMFIFLPMFGIIQGFSPIVGFNYGAKQIKRVKSTVKIALKVLGVYCFIAFLVIIIFNHEIISMFTNDIRIIKIASYTIKIMFLAIPFVPIQIIASAFFQSVGRAKQALFLSLLRQIILLLPFVLIIPNLFGLGLFGVWICFPISDFISTVISAFMLKNEMKSLKFN